MSVCVFVGPTLPRAEAAEVLEATYLPPAKHGDVYRAASLLAPRAIGVIDGYFQWSPSVWHKEILWAIDQGIHVFGSASMGALRAAELAPFGMHGVGRIFAGYRDGALPGADDATFEDDDEVAVVHGPPESGYLAASEAMVNIRCTLADASAAGIIGAGTRERLVAIGKSMFFPGRDYRALLNGGRAAGLPDAELAALERWLPSGRVNQKRADALEMLEAMRSFVAANPAPARAGFTFQRTTLWARAVEALEPSLAPDPEDAAVLDELRLDAARCAALRRQALEALVGPVHSDTGASSDAPGQQRLEQAARREAAARVGASIPAPVLDRKLLGLVRTAGLLDSLRTRAERKQVRLARLQCPDIEAFSDLQLLELRDWYFSRVLGEEMPDDLDLWVRDAGHGDLMRFHQAIFREYLFRQHEDGAVPARRAG
jgi:hypothetical protein